MKGYLSLSKVINRLGPTHVNHTTVVHGEHSQAAISTHADKSDCIVAHISLVVTSLTDVSHPIT